MACDTLRNDFAAAASLQGRHRLKAKCSAGSRTRRTGQQPDRPGDSSARCHGGFASPFSSPSATSVRSVFSANPADGFSTDDRKGLRVPRPAHPPCSESAPPSGGGGTPRAGRRDAKGDHSRAPSPRDSCLWSSEPPCRRRSHRISRKEAPPRMRPRVRALGTRAEVPGESHCAPSDTRGARSQRILAIRGLVTSSLKPSWLSRNRDGSETSTPHTRPPHA